MTSLPSYFADYWDMYESGAWSAGKLASKYIWICCKDMKDIFLDAISDILPMALTVAGAILVVTLGWRLFRNFTRG